MNAFARLVFAALLVVSGVALAGEPHPVSEPGVLELLALGGVIGLVLKIRHWRGNRK